MPCHIRIRSLNHQEVTVVALWAALEAERRYCGNLTETLNRAPVTFTEREKLAFGIDPRTCRMTATFIKAQPGLVTSITALLKSRYIEFGMTAYDFQLRRKDAKAAADAKVDAAKAQAEIEKKQSEQAEIEKQSAIVARGETLQLDDDEDDEDDDVEMDDGGNGETANESFFDDEEEEAAPPIRAEPDEVAEQARKTAERAERRKAHRENLRDSFAKVHLEYRKKAKEIKWYNYITPSERVRLKITKSTIVVNDPVKYLWKVNMGAVLKAEFIVPDRKRELFGFLPKMATHSKASLGSLQASSYAERINSCANQVCTDGNSLLSTEEISMVVVLRMNRSFMMFMRKHYSSIGKTSATAVTGVGSDSDGDDSDADY
jgi:hypothetical protein